MSEYFEEGEAIKSDGVSKEKSNHESSETGSSRRKFLRTAAVGAIGAGAALSLKGVGNVQAQTAETGDVTLDAVMLNYVSSPDGSAGITTLTLTNTFTHTFRLSLSVGSTITIGTSTSNMPQQGPFSAGSSTFKQGVSVQVTDGITISDSVSYSTSTQAPGQPINTKFYGILGAKMRLQGDRFRLNFKFLDARSTFTAHAYSLQAGNWSADIRPSTVNSMLAQYPLIQNPMASSLAKPRFKKKKFHKVDINSTDTKTFVVSNGSSYQSNLTATFSAEIVNTNGFTDQTVKNSFTVGSLINVTLTSVQEVTSQEILTLRFELSNNTSAPKGWWFYRDRVFKNWVVVDERRLVATTGQATVSGVVQDANGYYIPNAEVSLTQGEKVYSANTDGLGRFKIATYSGEPLSTGYYTVSCGGVAQTAYVSTSESNCNLYGADTYQAQQPVMRDDYALLQ